MSDTRILISLDLTDEADDILAAATTHAKALNTKEIDLITVVKPVAYSYAGFDSGSASVLAGLDSHLRNHAQEVMTERASKYDIDPARIHIKMGHPATEIRSAAEELQTDLIVMGTHGRHGLGRLLGSTANAVLHGVPCNVLVVKIQD